jgi:hypothetical protein
MLAALACTACRGCHVLEEHIQSGMEITEPVCLLLPASPLKNNPLR